MRLHPFVISNIAEAISQTCFEGITASTTSPSAQKTITIAHIPNALRAAFCTAPTSRFPPTFFRPTEWARGSLFTVCPTMIPVTITAAICAPKRTYPACGLPSSAVPIGITTYNWTLTNLGSEKANYTALLLTFGDDQDFKHDNLVMQLDGYTMKKNSDGISTSRQNPIPFSIPRVHSSLNLSAI